MLSRIFTKDILSNEIKMRRLDEKILCNIFLFLAIGDAYNLGMTCGVLLLTFGKCLNPINKFHMRLSSLIVFAMQNRSKLLFRIFKNLKSIYSGKEFVTPSILRIISIDARLVQNVHFHLVSPEAIRKHLTASKFPSLTRLHLGGIGYASPGLITDICVRDALSSIGSQLESLKLTKLDELTHLSFDCISFFCTFKLRELRIVSCKGMLASVRPVHVKNFLTCCGYNMEYLDLRYSVDTNDVILHAMVFTKIKALKVFLASKSKTFEVISNVHITQREQYIRQLQSPVSISESAWMGLQRIYRASKLLYIDDLSSELYPNHKNKYIYQNYDPRIESELFLTDGLPLPSLLMFHTNLSAIPPQRLLGQSTQDNDSVCDDCFALAGMEKQHYYYHDFYCRGCLSSKSQGSDDTFIRLT
jgi:hypothetical protein